MYRIQFYNFCFVFFLFSFNEILRSYFKSYILTLLVLYLKLLMLIFYFNSFPIELKIYLSIFIVAKYTCAGNQGYTINIFTDYGHILRSLISINEIIINL